MVFKENSKLNENQNKTQNQTEVLLTIVEVDGFSSSVNNWCRLFFKLKICLLEIPQVSLFF